MSRKRKARLRARRSVAARSSPSLTVGARGRKGARVRTAHPHGRRLGCERLEDRRLLATVTVDVLDDSVDLADGRTSLREAVFATNTVSGADEIRFDPALFAGGARTILLTHGELAITDSLTITGPGAELLTIDASGNDPTPQVNNGDGSRLLRFMAVSGLATHTLTGVTLTGGDVLGDGGAVMATNSLSLANVRIVDNSATQPHATATDIARGGGVYATRVLTLRDSAIVGNHGGRGGGVWASGSSILGLSSVVERSLIEGNRALGTSAAGGIQFASSSGTVKDSIIRNNHAPLGTGGQVGGSIIRSLISENTGRHGGAEGVSTIDSSSIVGNLATDSGGGVWITFGPGATISNSTISGNRAVSKGGGIYAGGLRTIINSTISGNSANQGGGVFSSSSSADLFILHSTITNNEAVTHLGVAGRGGGVAISSLRVRNSIVAGNRSSGTAPDASSANVIIRYSLLGDNTGITGFGGLPEAPVGSPDERGSLIGGPVHGVIDPLLGPLADNGGPTLPDGAKLLTLRSAGESGH